MIPVVHTISINNTNLTEDLVCFQTDTYCGLYDENQRKWMICSCNDVYFAPEFIDDCETLDELDEAAYDVTGEHIKAADYKMNYHINFLG